MTQLELSEAQTGARIVVNAGDIVIVRLTERSGGGYRWTPASVDGVRLEMQDQRYETTRPGVGTPGASVWRFIARKPGRTRLELKQVRTWEPSDPAAERFWVDLDIRE